MSGKFARAGILLHGQTIVAVAIKKPGYRDRRPRGKLIIVKNDQAASLLSVDQTVPDDPQHLMNTEHIANYLAANVVIDSHDARQMENALKTHWQARSFAVPPSDKAFHSIARYRELDQLSVSFGYYGCGTQSDFEGGPFARQHFLISGAGMVNIRRKNFVLDPSNSCVIPSNTDYGWKFSDSCQHLTCRIPQTNLESMLTSLVGVSPRGGLQLGRAAANGPHFEQLRRFALLLADEASRSETPHIVIKELEDLFLTRFLLANDHNHRDRLLETPKQAAPRSVHLVEEYIVANWNRPFVVEEIAREFDMSARTIYATFQLHRGYGPKAFLRQTRLNKARELLQQGRYSVATVARMCCFASAGRFARYYQAAFGELPSNTRR